MSQGSFSVEINGAVLKWARDAAGQTTAAIARRLGVNEHTIDAWETGKKSPAWRTLRKLAKYYQRPLAALLLAQPPKEPDLPADFRTVRDSQRVLASDSLLAIRTARWLQARAVEIHHNLELEQRFPALRIPTAQEANVVADELRENLGVPISEQRDWKNSYEALRRWKECLEELDVLVFQFRFPRKELQGFSLFDPVRPTIVINEADAVEARIFTLFHEYAHLLLRKPGLCIPQKSTAIGKSVESYCNRFAASVLIPSDEARKLNISLQGSAGQQDAELKLLASRYRVSRYVVLIKLKDEERISEQTFSQIFRRWDRRRSTDVVGPRLKKPRRSGPSAVQKCMRQRGKAFISLVMQAEKRGVITAHDAVTYLGVKISDLNKLDPKV